MSKYQENTVIQFNDGLGWRGGVIEKTYEGGYLTIRPDDPKEMIQHVHETLVKIRLT